MAAGFFNSFVGRREGIEYMRRVLFRVVMPGFVVASPAPAQATFFLFGGRSAGIAPDVSVDIFSVVAIALWGVAEGPSERRRSAFRTATAVRALVR